MSEQQPKALHLAECLDAPCYVTFMQMEKAAAELRRLHESNKELLEALELLLGWQTLAPQSVVDNAETAIANATKGAA